MQVTNVTHSYGVEKKHFPNDGIPPENSRFAVVLEQEKNQAIRKNQPQNNSQPIDLDTNHGKN